MTHGEADVLAKRIINTWRGGPPLRDWIEELTTLDHGRAGTAYARLRRLTDHAPTIAKFLATYNELDTQRPVDRPKCGDCDGTGWVDAPERIWPDGRTSSQVKPCRCSEGQQRARSRLGAERNPTARVLDHRTDELDLGHIA